MIDEISQILNKKNELFKQFINNGKLQSDYDRYECIRNDLTESIRPSIEKFHLRLSAKLSDPSTSAKTCSILKTFVNGKNVPLIPSLLADGEFVTNILEKANNFNDFFSQPIPANIKQ